jgi:hypothetical protein
MELQGIQKTASVRGTCHFLERGGLRAASKIELNISDGLSFIRFYQVDEANRREVWYDNVILDHV